ncbi:Uridine nucleosidase 1 [Serendipita sp. 397]|nr:Uridine nucleosidase 1 [Serendipita sp. 397]
MTLRRVWLDCDPGHDDALAILLAVHCPNIQLLGVSTTHGNAPPASTHVNAVRCLHAFNAPIDVHAHRGATKPLIRPARVDPEIHGPDGLGGVEELLPTLDDPAVSERWQLDGRRSATDGIAKAVKNSYLNGFRVSIATTGPMTNLALFLTLHPELHEAIEEIVFMGGGVGIGNRSAVAEYNILCDPEAAQIVLDSPIRKVMIPLNVTHTCLFTSSVHRRLLTGSPAPQSEDPDPDPTSTLTEMPLATSPFRHMLSTICMYFASAYRSTFGFHNGPPLHDPLTIAYLCRPEIFTTTRYRVDVELAGTHTVGETVVDLWNYQKLGEDDWSKGKNCLVAGSVDVASFFNILLACVDKADQVTCLNK